MELTFTAAAAPWSFRVLASLRLPPGQGSHGFSLPFPGTVIRVTQVKEEAIVFGSHERPKSHSSGTGARQPE